MALMDVPVALVEIELAAGLFPAVDVIFCMWLLVSLAGTITDAIVAFSEKCVS